MSYHRPQLSNTKTIDNKQTLMHFLVEIIERRLPDALDFADELIHIEKAARGKMAPFDHVGLFIVNLHSDWTI